MVELPICHIDGCNNPAFCYVHGRFYCGECMHKLSQLNKKIMTLEIQAKLNGGE